jgi:hypothetical protein
MTNNVGSGVRLSFTANDEILTIAANTLVASSDEWAVASFSGALNSELINNGTVMSLLSDGVIFTFPIASVVNNADGNISGYNNGIYMDTSGNINNSGSISGFSASGLDFSISSSVTVVNYGKIFGHSNGIFEASATTGGGGNFTNLGSIKSDGYGIGISTYTPSNLTTFITNEANGVIQGAAGAINVQSGQFSLTNHGLIAGDIIDTANGNDTIINTGEIQGVVNLGGGNDVYEGTGRGSVTGGVHGGDGNDTFIGDRAPETFFGDAGSDTFVYNAVAFSPSTANHDTIGDFISGNGDRIDVHGIDANVTRHGHQHFVFIGTQSFAHYHALHPGVIGMLRFNTGTHALEGNVNANFHTAEFLVALPSTTTLQASDLIL